MISVPAKGQLISKVLFDVIVNKYMLIVSFRKPAQWAAKPNQVRRRRLSNGRKKRLRFRDFDYY